MQRERGRGNVGGAGCVDGEGGRRWGRRGGREGRRGRLNEYER